MNHLKIIDVCQIFRKHSSYRRLWVRIVFIVSHVCQSEELRHPRNSFCMTIFVSRIPITCKIYGTCYYCTFLYHELVSSWVLCVRGYVQFKKKKQGPTRCLYQTYFIAIEWVSTVVELHSYFVVIHGCNTVLVTVEKVYVNIGFITRVKPLSKIYVTIKYSSCLLSAQAGIQQ
jgi:hypothetical protein